MNGPGVTQPSLHSIYHGRCVKVEDGGGVLLRGAVTHDSSFDAAESSDARYLGDFAKEKARGAAVSFVARPFPDRQVQLGLEKQFFLQQPCSFFKSMAYSYLAGLLAQNPGEVFQWMVYNSTLDHKEMLLGQVRMGEGNPEGDWRLGRFGVPFSFA